jgi:hypothetical protein
MAFIHQLDIKDYEPNFLSVEQTMILKQLDVHTYGLRKMKKRYTLERNFHPFLDSRYHPPSNIGEISQVIMFHDKDMELGALSFAIPSYDKIVAFIKEHIDQTKGMYVKFHCPQSHKMKIVPKSTDATGYIGTDISRYEYHIEYTETKGK